MNRSTVYVVFLALLSFFCVGSTWAHETVPANTVYIHMTEDGFEPRTVSIVQGDTVIFENLDDEFRWPASNIHPTHAIYPEFDPLLPLDSGEEWSFTFTKVGEWRMHDHLLPEFTGVITVAKNDSFIEPVVPEKGNFFTRLFRGVGDFFVKVYYAILPGAQDARLADASIIELAKDTDALDEILRHTSPKLVMERLIDETDGGARVDCHSQAHVVGRQAYNLFGVAVYTEGDASCHSGFYHGVMEAFIADKGTVDLVANVETLCEGLNSDVEIFECYHGVGHGMMAYNDYNLMEALEACTGFTDEYDDSSCYGGVFMENIIAGIGKGVDGHDTTWLKEDDPHYPCNAIGDDYSRLWNCYVIQTSWMLPLFDFDYQKTADTCLGAREDMRNACFTSYGRDSAGNFLRDSDKILASCKLVPDIEDYRSACYMGALNVVISFWGSNLKNQGEEFCALLPEKESKPCFDAVALRKADLGL